MDEIIKLLQKLMAKKPSPKGGIADTAAGVDFIGKRLSKEQLGDMTIIGSKLTDASRFRPFDIRNVGRDKRYMYMREYSEELQSNFQETLKFIQDNPDIRLNQAQKDNIIYNVGVLRRVNAETKKLEKGYIDEGKNPEDIYKKTDEERPLDELPFVKILERTNKTMEEFQKKIRETEDIFKPPSADELSAGQLRYNKLYNGPGYTSGNSSLYRGYGSSFLPRLHEKGIIKLDDEIYQNLKQGKHHHGGADFFAPDPIRIWRKHFGDDVFKKLDNFDPDNEDIFQWATRNNVQPINRTGPKNALEYMNSTEIGQRLTDEAELLKKYKNPSSTGDNAKYYYADKPDQRMERITYHGENVQGYEQALQKMDPEAYDKYAIEFRKPVGVSSENVIPFNKNKDIYEQAQDLKSFEKDVIDTLYAPIKPDLKIVKSDKQLFEDAKTSLANNKEYQKLKKEQTNISQGMVDLDELNFTKNARTAKTKIDEVTETSDIPEWAQKSLDRLNELKKYYSKNPPNNKDTLNLYNKQIIQREKALRHTLESGGDEAMFEKLRIGPKTNIPEVFETNKYVDLLPTNQEKTMRNVDRQFGFEVDESASKVGEGKFTKAQVLIQRLKNTIKQEPNDKYVQETFPGFIKEIEADPKLADNPNVQEAFGLTDLSDTADQRLVEYSDGTLDFYTKGNKGGMESVQSLIDELGISQDEALRIKQLEPEDQILEITRIRTLKNKPKKAQGGLIGLHI